MRHAILTETAFLTADDGFQEPGTRTGIGYPIPVIALFDLPASHIRCKVPDLLDTIEEIHYLVIADVHPVKLEISIISFYMCTYIGSVTATEVVEYHYFIPQCQ